MTDSSSRRPGGAPLRRRPSDVQSPVGAIVGGYILKRIAVCDPDPHRGLDRDLPHGPAAAGRHHRHPVRRRPDRQRGDQAAGARAARSERLLPEQYWRWISGVLQGDFGFSLRNTEPVSNIVLDSLTVTLELVILALLIAIARRRAARRHLCRQARQRRRLRRADRRPGRAQHPQLLAGDAAAAVHLTRVRLGPSAHLHLSLGRPDREPEPVHPPGDLDLGLHDGDRDAHGARDDAGGARAGLRPHRPGEGRRPENGDHEARAAERLDPRGHDRRLRDRGADRRRRDRRDHLRAARSRLHAPAGDLRPRLPGHPGDDADDRVHLHLRQPARGHPLRRPRPEDRRRNEPQTASSQACVRDRGRRRRRRPPGRRCRGGAWPRSASGATRSAWSARRSSSSTSSSPCSARYVWTVDPDELVGLRFEDPSWAHPMGTDEIGRDTLARIIHGAQVSLQVGAISVSIAFVGGVVFGMLAGYYKGIVDTAADAHRRHHVLAARDRPRDRDRRPARAEPPQRDDRDRDRDPARLRAGRARRRARGDGLSVHRVGPCARSGRLADHAAPRDPQHRRAAARAGHGLPVGRDPGRGGAQLPRARHAAAGGLVGRDAEHRANLHRHHPVAVDLPGRSRS